MNAAVAAYDGLVHSAKDALKLTMAGIRDNVMADPTVVSTRANMIIAHDAYEAAEHTTSEPALELACENAEKEYHDALKAARVANQTAAEAAVTAYRTAVTSASSTGGDKRRADRAIRHAPVGPVALGDQRAGSIPPLLTITNPS